MGKKSYPTEKPFAEDQEKANLPQDKSTGAGELKPRS